MKRLITLTALFLYLLGCSRGDIARVATIAATGDAAGVGRMAKDKAVGYALNPKALERDVKRFAGLLEKFRKIISGTWGDREVREPRPKEYVKYTQNYLSRASVDFDKGLVTIETLDPDRPAESLRTAIVTTLLTPEDPRAVDLYSAEPIRLGATPFLLGEILDRDGKEIRWAWRAERYADWLVRNRLQTRTVPVGGKEKTVRFVTLQMVPDHHRIRAVKYRPHVEQYAKRFSVSRNLVYAVIQTESDFNPFAVSPASAFGLMQIVPSTAGADVHRFLGEKGGRPTKEFLFVPENNIRYGTAYLHLLDDSYLKEVADPVSREYCVIAAYNTGAGNVLRTFDPDRKRAPARINALSRAEVYQTLRTRLAHAEARRYLMKVIDAKKDFVGF